jgi:hypothetical protein
MDPFSIIGLIIFGILAFFLTRVVSVLVRIVFIGLIVTLFLVFFFGISLNEVMDWVVSMALLVV